MKSFKLYIRDLEFYTQWQYCDSFKTIDAARQSFKDMRKQPYGASYDNMCKIESDNGGVSYYAG